MAWTLNQEEERLLKTEIDKLELFKPGQHGNDVHLVTFADGSPAIFKGRAGERTSMLGAVPGTLYRREVAAYRVDREIGFGLAPTTVFRDVPDAGGIGAMQAYVDAAGLQIVDYSEVDKHTLATLDYLLASGDRHQQSNWMTYWDGRPAAVDNGLSLPTVKPAGVGSGWTDAVLNQPVLPFVAAQVWRASGVRLADILAEAEIETDAIDQFRARLACLQSVTLTWPY